MDYITGTSREQVTMLPNCVEDYVSADNPVRVVDAFIEKLDLEKMGFIKFEPNHTGRPMYSPKDLLRLYLYGYMNRVRSSRNLERECWRNLEVIWLMHNLKPDHKTIARFRQSNAKALKNVFHSFVRLGVQLGLYGQELIAVDGSKFKANNSKERNFTKGKIADRIHRIDEKVEQYLDEMNAADATEDAEENRIDYDRCMKNIEELLEKKEMYLEMESAVNSSEETQVSLTDPDSRLMKTKDGMMVSLNVQTAVDSKNKMIAAFFATSQTQDKNMMAPTAQQAAENMACSSLTVVADKGYDSASDVAQVVLNGHTPVITGSEYEITIPTDTVNGEIIADYNPSIARAVFIPEKNVFICPMGNYLFPSAYVKSKHEAKYKNCKACRNCPNRCIDARYYVASRFIKLSEFSREYDGSPMPLQKHHVLADPNTASQRKCIIEHVFGSVKLNLGISYLLLRGIPKAEGELSLAFLAYNIKRAIQILGVECLVKAIQA